jgi:hypothetical protein
MVLGVHRGCNVVFVAIGTIRTSASHSRCTRSAPLRMIETREIKDGTRVFWPFTAIYDQKNLCDRQYANVVHRAKWTDDVARKF